MTSASNGCRPEPPPDHLASGLRHRRFRPSFWWFVSAMGTSGFGNGLVLVAFPLLALRCTSQPLEIAGVAVAGQLPWLIVSLPAGALADRVDRRRLVVGIEILRVLGLSALGAIVLSSSLSNSSLLRILYLAAFIIGSLETAFSAATRASLPTLVPADDLPRANGYLFSAETAGEQFAGPALGGLLFTWVRAAPFFGDAASFAASAALLAKALPTTNRERTSDLTLIGDLRVGLRWFRHHPLLRRLAAILAVFGFCQSAVMSVLVLYGVNTLHLTRAGYGIFLAVGAIGDVAGSLLAQRAYDYLGPARAIVVAGMAAAACYVVLAGTSNRAVAVGAYALEAAAIALGNVATLSLRQQLIPTELFGRINNVFRTFVYGAVPVGALAGGVLATFNLPATFLAAGVVQLLLIAVTARRLSAAIADLSSPAD
jgi:predicted MFS family arabinose efflux permease